MTDTVYAATMDIVWEALWDQARKLKRRETEQLEYDVGRKKNVDYHMLNVLRENYTRPLDSESGQSIVTKKWAEVLYHTNRYIDVLLVDCQTLMAADRRYMQRGSLMENYAIRKLQEQMICQVCVLYLLLIGF